MAGRIINELPDCPTYVEPFGGAASVLLNKEPSPVEVYNDLDGRLTRLFQVIRDNPDEFRRRLTSTPYSEIEFDAAVEPSDDPVEQARRDFVRWRMSLGGRGADFSFTLHRVRRDMADVVSGYLSAIDQELPKIAARLRTVQIMNRPAIEVIRKWDSPQTVHYVDPPYVHSTRSQPKVYAFEMTDDDHRELAAVLLQCKGAVVLSGYSSPLYEELYSGWRKVVFDMPNHAAGGREKNRVEEVLWCSRP